MVDIEKVEKIIESLENSSVHFKNLSGIIDSIGLIVEKVKKDKNDIFQIKQELKIALSQLDNASKELKKHEHTLNDTIKNLISNLNSKNIKIFEAYKDEMNFNLNTLKTDVTSTLINVVKINGEQIELSVNSNINKSTNTLSEEINKSAQTIWEKINKSEKTISEEINSSTKKSIENTNLITSLINKNKIFIYVNTALLVILLILLILLYIK